MPFNINEMRSELVGGGARPSLFSVQISNRVNPTADFKIPFMVRASSIPADTIASIDVPYFGRKIKVAGDRTFEDWTVTVTNDEDFAIRNAMEEWMSIMNTHVSNLRLSATPEEYKSDAIVKHYGKNGDVLRIYRMNGIFPTSIASIPLAWDTNDTIETFDISFAYDWWDIVPGGSTGNALTNA